MRNTNVVEWPLKWKCGGLLVLFVAVLLFGGLVEYRNVFLPRPMGDLGAYLKPAWAIRTGRDPYQITDHNGWHYVYPPLLAILLVPLADAPPGVDRLGLLPISVSTAIWYAFNVLCLVLAVHWLASALETTSPDETIKGRSFGGRRWWSLRLLPVLACLPPIGHTLMRGQVNLLILALLCGMMAALLRGRSVRGGLFLAGAICIKVIPAFLLLLPLWRRDWRFAIGCAGGLVVGLMLVPVAAFGPARAFAYSQEFVQVTLAPGLGLGADESRAQELTWITSTDSQSLLAVLHNTSYPDPLTRPHEVPAHLRYLAYLIGGGLTLVTLLAVGWRRPLSGPYLVLFGGALTLNMLILSPICHLHYFSLALPIMMSLVVLAWQRHGGVQLGVGLTVLMVVNVITYVLPNLPGLENLRDKCVSLYPALLVWGVAVFALARRPGERPLAA
jgi:alpha-1,2-mannosyltransferase